MMKRQMRMFRIAAFVVAALVAGACGPGTAPLGQPPMAVLTGQTFDTVREQFNAAADHMRVVLLLSPTCGTCLKGATAVDEILRRYPDAKVTVLAVWQPMLPTDISAPTTGTLDRLSDRRVRQFYDADHLLAKRLKEDARASQPVQECCTRQGILWDLIAIYPPNAMWTDKMPVATFFNGTIVDSIEGLEKALNGK